MLAAIAVACAVTAGALATAGQAAATSHTAASPPTVSAGASCTPTTVLLPISGVTAHAYSPFCRFSGGFKDAFDKVDYQMQTDGNMVVYSTGAGSRPLWSSGTAGHSGAYADLQGDCNLVIYDTATPRHSLWSSRTAGQTPCELAVQSDGNVVLYRRVTGGLRAVWATNTSH